MGACSLSVPQSKPGVPFAFSMYPLIKLPSCQGKLKQWTPAPLRKVAWPCDGPPAFTSAIPTEADPRLVSKKKKGHHSERRPWPFFV